MSNTNIMNITPEEEINLAIASFRIGLDSYGNDPVRRAEEERALCIFINKILPENAAQSIIDSTLGKGAYNWYCCCC